MLKYLKFKRFNYGGVIEVVPMTSEDIIRRPMMSRDVVGQLWTTSGVAFWIFLNFFVIIIYLSKELFSIFEYVAPFNDSWQSIFFSILKDMLPFATSRTNRIVSYKDNNCNWPCYNINLVLNQNENINAKINCCNKIINIYIKIT